MDGGRPAIFQLTAQFRLVETHSWGKQSVLDLRGERFAEHLFSAAQNLILILPFDHSGLPFLGFRFGKVLTSLPY
jgi:hypothetical protein